MQVRGGFSLSGLLVGILIAGAAHAQSTGAPPSETAEPDVANIDIRPSIRAVAWSSDRELSDRRDIAQALFWLDTTARFSDKVSLRYEGWLAAQHSLGEGTHHSRTREGYLQCAADAFEVRLGWQILSWGRADRINPTDQVTGRDYTLLVNQDEDQRIGAPMMRVDWFQSEGSRLQSLVKLFRPSLLPSFRQEQVIPLRNDRNDSTEWGLKFDRTGQQLDWSVSYFDGYDKQRSVLLNRLGGQVIGLVKEYPKIQMIGFDSAMVKGQWAFHTELAYTHMANSAVADAGGKVSNLFGVLGIERNFDEDRNLNLQWFFRKFRDDLQHPESYQGVQRRLLQTAAIANGQFNDFQHGISLRFGQELWNARLDYELLGVYNFGQKDYAFRPRLNYQLNDSVRISIGGDLFRGQNYSFFGSLRENSVAFIETVWTL